MTLDRSYDQEEKINVVTTIFGGNENIAPRSSAIPGIFDEWFHGDFKESWEGTLTGATGSKVPDLEEYASSFPAFRMNTGIEIGIDIDGNTVQDWDVDMTDPTDNNNTIGGMSPVTLEEEFNNPFRNQLDYYDNGNQFLNADVKGPYTRINGNFSVEGPNGNTVEGVRASIILGGSDPYLQRLKQDVETIADITTGSVPIYLSRYLAHVATFYSFIDFAFMADGTNVVTVWDASVYPAHALYVGEDFEGQNDFRKGIEWVEQGPASDHQAFVEFGLDAQNPYATPFDQGGWFFYADTAIDRFRIGFGDHPVMQSPTPGTVLSTNEAEFNNPMLPNFIQI